MTQTPRGPGGQGEPGRRGSLTIADRVIEKVAAQAVGEVAHTVALDAKIAGRLAGRSAARARATAVVSGRLVQLRLEVGLAYPVPVVPVVREIRRHVAQRVGSLCAVEVRDIDIDVVRLRRPGPEPRARPQ